MPLPDYRHERRSDAEPFVEDGTFYSAEKTPDGRPVRTYHVRRVNVGRGWSYQVSMEVVATTAAEDVLGPAARSGVGPRALWSEIWPEIDP